MKKLLFLLAVLLTGTMAMAQNATTTPGVINEPLEKRVEFKNAEHKLGKIPLGKPVEFTIEMKNIGHDT
jgi:hypothetical protein